ncbi:Saccharopine dehydrogenase-like oxidoreductase [Pleurotus pulmonarius]
MTSYDILLLGATGYTGRLILRYLHAHPQHEHNPRRPSSVPECAQGPGLPLRSTSTSTFTFAIAARSQARLDATTRGLGIDCAVSGVHTLLVDVTNAEQLERAVRGARVVINAVGPFRRWGTPVVSACVRCGTHYVDISGELPWIRSIITRFDYAATKSRTIVVPACGMDSIPSDYSAYLSKKTLDRAFQAFQAFQTFQAFQAFQAFRQMAYSYSMESSTTVYDIRGAGLSGGSWGTILAWMEEVPREELECMWNPCVLSPVQPPENVQMPPRARVLYRMPYAPHIVGGFFSMSLSNIPIVERTWGLLEYQALSTSSGTGHSTLESPRYGPEFRYDEFVQAGGVLSAVMSSIGMLAALWCLRMFSWARWLFRRFIPRPGEGPADDSLGKGYLEVTNVTVASSSPTGSSDASPAKRKPIVVKSRIRGHGDPGYYLTSVMAAESALCIVFSYASLPPLARGGGVLTPVTAFGDVLIERLTGCGLFEFTSEVLQGGDRDDDDAMPGMDDSAEELLS